MKQLFLASVVILLLSTTLFGQNQSKRDFILPVSNSVATDFGFVISGTVSDQIARLPGAVVTVVGTSTGTMTNGLGEFSLVVATAGDHTLRVTYVGCVSTDTTVSAPRTHLNIKIECEAGELNNQLEEVESVFYDKSTPKLDAIPSYSNLLLFSK